MKTKQTLTFKNMPKHYAGLCGLFLPRPIHDRVGYENTVEIADAFAGFEDRMNRDQSDYFDLLCSLIADYESVKPPKLDGLDLLKHLVAEHGLSGAELSRILGKSVALGPMILRGQRSVTASHARMLGEYFGLPAGLFLG
jgi:antitoxin component HigA of HigAB toxin-antitoxin module